MDLEIYKFLICFPQVYQVLYCFRRDPFSACIRLIISEKLEASVQSLDMAVDMN